MKKEEGKHPSISRKTTWLNKAILPYRSNSLKIKHKQRVSGTKKIYLKKNMATCNTVEYISKNSVEDISSKRGW